MKLAPLFACLLALAMPGSAMSQSTDAARADGKETARELLETARSSASAPVDANRLPNFDPAGVQGLETLADDPDRIESNSRSAAQVHEGYRAMEESLARRARFDPSEIEAVIARAGTINDAPLDYTSGMAIGGSQGQCVELPPGSASAGTYIATCNSGTSGELVDASCTASLVPEVTTTSEYDYYCLPNNAPDNGKWSCQHYTGGSCYLYQSAFVHCASLPQFSSIPCRGQNMIEVHRFRCGVQVGGFAPDDVTTTRTVDVRLDDSQCLPLAQASSCSQVTETCSDASPQTRVVDGVSITRSCWEWQRDYQCLDTVSGNDCGEIEANPECRFLREECLTDETPCQTSERLYECALPPDGSAPAQYICDGDVYCIDGSCETIERTANDEFKDAVVALNAMNQARGEFDPDTLTLFTGTRNTCSSKVFGVLNCCKGKGFPLIPGISLLVALGCDREEVLLHERDAQGLCAYVGTYCSDKFLGVCLTKRKAYCCFESKLSRILQEQGRKQLPKPWDKPKEEQCEGFTLDEFAQLDLSRMDFSEVYAEFTEAARLPDELETSILIQQKIDDYYARGGQ